MILVNGIHLSRVAQKVWWSSFTTPPSQPCGSSACENSRNGTSLQLGILLSSVHDPVFNFDGFLLAPSRLRFGSSPEMEMDSINYFFAAILLAKVGYWARFACAVDEPGGGSNCREACVACCAAG